MKIFDVIVSTEYCRRDTSHLYIRSLAVLGQSCKMVSVAQQWGRWSSQKFNLTCFNEDADYGDLGWKLCCSVSVTTVGHWHSDAG
jgi:hypothetical protein